MNTKTHPINPSSANPLRFALIGGLISVASISLVAGLVSIESGNQPVPTYAAAPATYAIQSLKITSPTSGTAIITLGDFILNVGFDFETHADDYGVQGSEFTNVTISNLAIEKIVSTSGTEFGDFTDRSDHQQFNAMIVGYILQHRLVEGV